MYDLIIRKGHVIDSRQKISKIMDIGVRRGKIEALKNEIEEDGMNEIDALGCFVTPGFIDYHLHMFAGGSRHGVPPDMALLANGVTTGVDGGTCGSANYEVFHKHIAQNSIAKIKACINIAEEGLVSFSFNEHIDPCYYKPDAIRKVIDRYPGEIVGIKLRTSKGIAAPLTSEPLERTLEIAEQLKLPVIVHVSDPSFSIERLALMLRPGDVFCHMYQGKGETILDERGHVKPGIKKAREKGVIFDACNGKGNYSFRVAVPAMKEGFYPDILSTDLGPLTCYQHPVISLPFLMSKYINMGMELEQVVDMVTASPARQIGEEQLGTLACGTAADIAVFRMEEREVTFYDCDGMEVKGQRILIPQLTVKDGTIVYRQTGF
ncbi:amidohydrolase family protein [Clostridium sp. MCC353]|uniref:amidohydrolase family protein n=1 Tax=Clostridium sp. MCC353 TaxID=2592646 RepID=UPI001C032487|nr:amidohydrolase family protein [Clostridium sp. MCC353]MBT9777935.1 amidohydrolase family protein [Clostridium sp. MCC353]